VPTFIKSKHLDDAVAALKAKGRTGPFAKVKLEEIDEGQSVTFSGSWHDPGELDTFTVWWDFGDGTHSDWGKVPLATHVYTKKATYKVKLTVRDDDGVTDWQQVSIAIADPAPVAKIDATTPTGVNEDVAADPGVIEEVEAHVLPDPAALHYGVVSVPLDVNIGMPRHITGSSTTRRNPRSRRSTARIPRPSPSRAR
jgi:chitodextrinase